MPYKFLTPSDWIPPASLVSQLCQPFVPQGTLFSVVQDGVCVSVCMCMCVYAHAGLEKIPRLSGGYSH